jgi:NRAMP (natural resistance-associated macrophage protein)-like metal ion transporter
MQGVHAMQSVWSCGVQNVDTQKLAAPSVATDAQPPAKLRPLRASSPRERVRATLHALGPGLVSGAADDDPSGIATYTQAGAQYGYGLVWTTLVTTPLMIGIQMAAAQVGRVTGAGLAANLRRHYSRPLIWTLVGLLVFANTVNITADVAAMGEALQLLVGGGEHGHALLIGLGLIAIQLRLPYARLAAILKWLCLALFAYVLVLFYVHVDWPRALQAMVWPRLSFDVETMTFVVAVLGTTISPYLFFWQAAQEVEEMRRKGRRPLLEDPASAAGSLLRIRFDTVSGMVLSNAIALAIMLAAAGTLHANGVTHVATAAQAAEALRPLAGNNAYILFALGVVFTGLLAVPVLAGSAAYAVAECFGWNGSLDLQLREARGFYAILIGATLAGTLLDFTPIDPIRALFVSALVNGIVAVPIMVLLVHLAGNRAALGALRLRGTPRVLAWLATLLVGLAVAFMLVTELHS